MNDARRDKDFDWLYGNDDPTAEETRVFSAEEQALMNQPDRRPDRGTPPPRDTRAEPMRPPPQGPPPQQPQPRPQPTRPPRGPQQRRPRKRRRPIRRFLGVLVLVWLLFLIGTPLFAWTSGTSLDAMPDGERPAEQPGTAVLLVGSDGRDDLTDEERAELGTGEVEGNRADTIMLLYRPPSGRSVVMSLPRDSYVTVPGHGETKLNSAFAHGGAKLLVETVERNTGIRVDGYLEVGFLGVVNAVDAVGGIEVCLDAPIQDDDAHLDLPAGCQTLGGVDALGYVRMRKSDPRGDLGRVERQREVIGKVMKKALSPMTLINPVRYWNINMAAATSLARSEGFGPGAIFSAGSTFIGAAFGSGISVTVPVSGTPTVGGQSVVMWDETASQEMFDAIINGDTESLSQFER